MKKLVYGLIALICSCMASFAFASVAPSVAGSWRVTFYLENGRATGATQCLVFTSVPGLVNGVPTSGRWTSPTFPGWTGQWMQLGDYVRFFGVTSSLATIGAGNIANSAIMGGVSFNHFAKTNGVTSTSGNISAVRVRSCTALDAGNFTTFTGGDDPAKQ